MLTVLSRYSIASAPGTPTTIKSVIIEPRDSHRGPITMCKSPMSKPEARHPGPGDAVGKVRQRRRGTGRPLEGEPDARRCDVGVLGVLGTGQSRLSFHLKALKDAGLVRDRHQGRLTYYALDLAAFRALAQFLESAQTRRDRPAGRQEASGSAAELP